MPEQGLFCVPSAENETTRSDLDCSSAWLFKRALKRLKKKKKSVGTLLTHHQNKFTCASFQLEEPICGVRAYWYGPAFNTNKPIRRRDCWSSTRLFKRAPQDPRGFLAKSMQMTLLCEKTHHRTWKPGAGNNHRRIVCKQEMLSTSNLCERQTPAEGNAPPGEREISQTVRWLHFFFFPSSFADEQQSNIIIIFFTSKKLSDSVGLTV